MIVKGGLRGNNATTTIDILSHKVVPKFYKEGHRSPCKEPETHSGSLTPKQDYKPLPAPNTTPEPSKMEGSTLRK
jgi:CDP-diacylglycerol pyrophosphatase